MEPRGKKRSLADRRVRITPELEEKILSAAGTDKFAESLPTLRAAVAMYEYMQRRQAEGARFELVAPDGEVTRIVSL